MTDCKTQNPSFNISGTWLPGNDGTHKYSIFPHITLFFATVTGNKQIEICQLTDRPTVPAYYLLERRVWVAKRSWGSDRGRPASTFRTTLCGRGRAVRGITTAGCFGSRCHRNAVAVGDRTASASLWRRRRPCRCPPRCLRSSLARPPKKQRYRMNTRDLCRVFTFVRTRNYWRYLSEIVYFIIVI